MTAIGHWNPAWGPEPVKVKDKPEHAAHRNDWHLISCPRQGCRNHEGALVYAPRARRGEEPPERYVCAICGCQMRQERVKRAGRA